MRFLTFFLMAGLDLVKVYDFMSHLVFFIILLLRSIQFRFNNHCTWTTVSFSADFQFAGEDKHTLESFFSCFISLQRVFLNI